MGSTNDHSCSLDKKYTPPRPEAASHVIDANNKLIATERDQLKAALAQRTVSTPNGDQSQGEMVLNQSVSSAP